MNTLADVLREADPIASETRSHEQRARTRAAVLSGRRQVHFDARPVQQWRAALVAAVLVIAAAGAGIFTWRQASVDAVAAVQFEARIEEDRQLILNNIDIMSATMVPGTAPATFNIALTFTEEGAEKMRTATADHIGEHLQLILDDQVVMAPLIRAAISSSAVLSGNYTNAEAQRIIDGLMKGKLALKNTQ